MPSKECGKGGVEQGGVRRMSSTSCDNFYNDDNNIPSAMRARIERRVKHMGKRMHAQDIATFHQDQRICRKSRAAERTASPRCQALAAARSRGLVPGADQAGSMSLASRRSAKRLHTSSSICALEIMG